MMAMALIIGFLLLGIVFIVLTVITFYCSVFIFVFLHFLAEKKNWTSKRLIIIYFIISFLISLLFSIVGCCYIAIDLTILMAIFLLFVANIPSLIYVLIKFIKNKIKSKGEKDNKEPA